MDSLWTRGNLDGYWARAESGLHAARAQGDSSLVALILAARGQAQARLGMIKDAEPNLRASIRLCAADGNSRTQRSNLRWMGVVLGRLGRYDEAFETYSRLLRMAQEADDVRHMGWAWSGRAFTLWERGRSREAAAEYANALPLFRRAEEPGGEAFASNGLGTAVQRLGDYGRAADLYRQAAASARAGAWPWMEAIAWNNIAALHYSLGDPGQAREMFARALALHRQAGDMAETALTQQNIALCDAALGHHDDGIRELTRLRQECAELGAADLADNLGIAMGSIRFDQGRPAAAAALYREVIRDARGRALQSRRTATIGLLRALAAMDSVDQALASLADAHAWFADAGPADRIAYDLESARCRLLSREPDAAYRLASGAARQAARLGPRSLRIQALTLRALSAHRVASPDSAIASFREALAVWEEERGLPADPQWREVRGAAAQEIVPGLATLLLDTGGTNASPGERARAAFDAVQVYKARTLLERMRGPAGEETPPLDVVPVRCADLQETVLRPGELLLDFYLGPDSSLVFAIDRDTCIAYGLAPARRIEAVVEPYSLVVSKRPAPRGDGEARTDAEAASTSGIDEASRRIHDVLLGPLRAAMRQTHGSVVVVPDGILDRVSFPVLFAAAAARSGSPTPAVQTAPSATVFTDLRRKARSHGASDAPARGPAILALSPAEGDSQGNIDARAEALDLATRYRRVRSAGGDSAHTLFRGAAPGILHIAAHATVDEEAPWQAQIVLGDVLTASAIVRSRIESRLVVLSTCGSARGRMLPGEGVQGLASAFLVAGVPAVVASLWPVDGADTRLLMRRFYDALARGCTVAEALRRAQEEVRSDPATRHPFHWGGFIVLGDGDLRVPVQRRSPIERFLAPALLFAAGAAAILWHPLRRRRAATSAVIHDPRLRLQDEGSDRARP